MDLLSGSVCVWAKAHTIHPCLDSEMSPGRSEPQEYFIDDTWISSSTIRIVLCLAVRQVYAKPSVISAGSHNRYIKHRLDIFRRIFYLKKAEFEKLFYYNHTTLSFFNMIFKPKLHAYMKLLRVACDLCRTAAWFIEKSDIATARSQDYKEQSGSFWDNTTEFLLTTL